MSQVDDISAPRPWVLVAAFCQTAIVEANTGHLSVIKMIDGVTLAGATKEMQPTPIQLTMALVVKSGEMHGQYNIKVRCNSPSQVPTDGPNIPFYFEGKDRGVQVVLPIGIFAVEQGIYWFDIMLEEEILTRVPLRVMYRQVQMPDLPGMTGQGGAGTL